MIPERNQQIAALIDYYKPRTICEVGTWTGEFAAKVCKRALRHRKNVHYTGYDLWEEGTEEDANLELHVREQATRAQAEENLQGIPGLKYTLVMGHTAFTLRKQKFDLASIDGGRSVQTMQHDYNMLRDSKVVVLNNFYDHNGKGFNYDLKDFGCNLLMLKRGKEMEVLPASDPGPYGSKVKIAVVT